MGNVPLCCVLLLGQALCSYALTPRPNGGALAPLPGCGFKAAGQCKLGFPGPARLLLLAQSLLCCQLRQLSLKGASDTVPAPQDGKTHLQRSGQMCVLNARHRTVFAFTQAGVWRPKQEYISMAWLLFRILCWNSGSRLRDQEGAMAGRFQRAQFTAFQEARSTCCSPRGWDTARGDCLR